MKKIMLFVIALVLLRFPMAVSAKSYSFGGYYCDAKEDQKDGTFKEVCHIQVTSDFNINHIKLKLQLKNLVLESVKTNSDWTNKNGLSSDMEFTSTSAHQGSFLVADLVFMGNTNDEECEASIIPVLAESKEETKPEPEPEPETKPEPEPETKPESKVCVVLDNVYYGKNGTKVDIEKYYEQCGNYSCTVVDNKYYFNSQGKSVSYDAMMQDCSLIEGPETGFNYGYIFLAFGIVCIVAINAITKKNTKIFKI